MTSDNPEGHQQPWVVTGEVVGREIPTPSEVSTTAIFSLVNSPDASETERTFAQRIHRLRSLAERVTSGTGAAGVTLEGGVLVWDTQQSYHGQRTFAVEYGHEEHRFTGNLGPNQFDLTVTGDVSEVSSLVIDYLEAAESKLRGASTNLDD